jgi:ubiquinone/menaquinone biosynthesis C-methylase UbiE
MGCAIRLSLAFVWLAVASVSMVHAQEPASSAGVQQHGDKATDHFAHRFDNVEELVKRFDDPSRDEWQMPARVIDSLQLTPGNVVADIGAGTGYFTVRLARAPARPKVYAVDIESAMITHLRHRAMLEGLDNVVAVHASATAAIFRNQWTSRWSSTRTTTFPTPWPTSQR